MKIMGLLKATAETEAGTPPSADLMQRMGAFVEEVAKAGVLVDTDGLKPTSAGKRVKLENAWPKSVEVGTLQAGGTSLVTETLVLHHEGLQVE